MTTYRLNVKKRKDLLERLLTVLPDGTRLSMEGDFPASLETRYLYSEKEQGQLVRQTSSPKQDFWIFQLNDECRTYLQADLIHRIGLRANVLHVLCEFEGRLLFEATDCFDEESVFIEAGEHISLHFVEELKAQNIIRTFEETES